MKLIIFNKKTTGIYIIIIGLMLVMLGVANRFDDRLRSTSLIQNNIKALKVYDIKDIDISYKLPQSWNTEEEKFPGGEILYHNNFISQDGITHGYVQLWKLRGDLESFINTSIQNSKIENKIYKYIITKYEFQNLNGFKVVYKINTKSNTNYIAYEYFLKKNDKFIRMAFYTKEKEFKESMENNYETLVKTLKSGSTQN